MKMDCSSGMMAKCWILGEKSQCWVRNHCTVSNELDCRGIEKAMVVELSIGRRIAIGFVLKYPEMFSKPVLADPGVDGYTLGSDETKRFYSELNEAFKQEDRRSAFAKRLLPWPYLKDRLWNTIK